MESTGATGATPFENEKKILKELRKKDLRNDDKEKAFRAKLFDMIAEKINSDFPLVPEKKKEIMDEFNEKKKKIMGELIKKARDEFNKKNNDDKLAGTIESTIDLIFKDLEEQGLDMKEYVYDDGYTNRLANLYKEYENSLHSQNISGGRRKSSKKYKKSSKKQSRSKHNVMTGGKRKTTKKSSKKHSKKSTKKGSKKSSKKKSSRRKH